jgi:hypothetical protein
MMQRRCLVYWPKLFSEFHVHERAKRFHADFSFRLCACRMIVPASQQLAATGPFVSSLIRLSRKGFERTRTRFGGLNVWNDFERQINQADVLNT